MSKNSLYLDLDGFFILNDHSRKDTTTGYWKEVHEYLLIDKEEQTREDLFEQFYFGFKSSINIVNNDTEKSIKKEHLERLFELCLSEAVFCVQKYEDGTLNSWVICLSSKEGRWYNE